MSIDNVGARIKKLRKEQKYTLKDISKKSGISVSFLSDIENNRSKPSLERLTDIANVLNTSTSYLLGENTKCNSLKEKIAQDLINKLYEKGYDLTKDDIPDLIDAIELVLKLKKK